MTDMMLRLAEENLANWQAQVDYNRKMGVHDPVHDIMLDKAKQRLADLKTKS